MENQHAQLLSLKNIGVRKSQRWLVRGVSLSVSPGEIVTIIGPNGSGKSTTAEVALGVTPPTEGEAIKRKNLRVSYVPQKINIDWSLPLTVSRFMSLTQKISSKDRDIALGLTKTSHLVDTELRFLSGGEFQRVLLARALSTKPELLVLDEPVQGVDYNGEIEMYQLIDTVRKEMNCGVLLISHDLHVVMAATDQVICLNGHVCCSGTPASVLSSPEFVHLFGAHAASGLAVYTHNHDHDHLPDGTCISKT